MERDPLDLDGWWQKKSTRDKLRDWMSERRKEFRNDGLREATAGLFRTANLKWVLAILAFFAVVYGSYLYREWHQQNLFIQDRCKEVMRDGQKVLECKQKDEKSFGSSMGFDKTR